MEKLEKICEVLALKRSRAERDVAETKMGLQAMDNRLESMQTQISDVSDDVFSGATSDDPIGDAIMLERWRDLALGNIRALQIQKKGISAQLDIEKQMLKEILVKEDIVNSNLIVKRRAHEQERLEGESSARLETWIISQSCSS